MSFDTSELKKAAEACDVTKCADEAEWDRRFSEFLSECDPDVTLAMLAEIEHLKAVAQREIEVAGERAKEVCGARMTLHALSVERDQLKAESEALRKDAENWQTVRRAMDQLKSDEQGAAIWSACSRILITISSDLNSARSVVIEEGVTKDGLEIGDWRVTVERLGMPESADVTDQRDNQNLTRHASNDNVD
ncbi:hypothetical protein K8374_09410 [Pseudomonas sp. p1(2021b)]|uniref:hypothetical protein n=1 Tax=Pseudomonas sp. p1(2021b) TaxID=2874628 RepID=UPI001CC9B89B|nr:hypothetical protein [Pseudomonas sp. p1(2021b)]UBM27147.1 hypothetical protein K8374_09410 [Pseudomonas sp. p1(2021b)]